MKFALSVRPQAGSATGHHPTIHPHLGNIGPYRIEHDLLKDVVERIVGGVDMDVRGARFGVDQQRVEFVSDTKTAGATGEGFGCLISALLCSTPVTGYSSNAGIIAITGIASRAAFGAAGIFLVLFGLVGKLSAVIASIPGPVIGGVFGVLCVIIAMNGFRVVRATPLTERNMLVIGLPILMALFATLVPPDFVKTLPDIVQYILGSSIAFGAVWAIVLHQILPNAR
ncbi:hypothetical protein X738_10560 [Mesorhizobium sp. LNHC209A00]|nr:hypothetical protein X738_10560 [Mesorhizobium sp. LNHC209A00]